MINKTKERVFDLENLRGWVINICTAVFFITAVEMIMPSNSFKKYSKFVLGLILIVTIMNPIVKALGSSNMEYGLKQEMKNLSSNYSEIPRSSEAQSTVNAFQENVKKVCQDKLKAKYDKDNFTVSVKADYDSQKSAYNILSIDITKNSSIISPIKKVQIGKENQNANDKQDEKAAEIKSYLSSELGVPENIINVG